MREGRSEPDFLNRRGRLPAAAFSALFLFFLFLIAPLGGCGPGATAKGENHHRYFPEIEQMALVVLPSRVEEKGIIRPKACFVDKYEVTRSQYREFLEESGYWPAAEAGFPFRKNHSGIVESSPGDGKVTGGAGNEEADGELPVACVNFHDAAAYAAFLGKQIPTRAEWLAAAGVTATHPYPWGDRFVRFFCNSLRSGIGGPVRVGIFESGRSPWGCYDMAGNVAEWTATITPESLRAGGVKVHSVMGGSFNDWGYPGESRKAFDILQTPRVEEENNRIFSLGFRCVRRDAVPLVATLVKRLKRVPPERRGEAARELFAAGRGIGDVLRLLDFMRRSTLVGRAGGLFTLDVLKGVFHGGGDAVLLKHLDGKLSVLTAGGASAWSAVLDPSDRVVPLSIQGGRTEALAVLERSEGRLSIRDPQRGTEVWSASGPGEPTRVAGILVGGSSRLLTSWTGPSRDDRALSSSSRLTLHDLKTGRLGWERIFPGPPSFLADGAGRLLVSIPRDDPPVTEIHLIALDTGRDKASTSLPGARSLRLFPAGADRSRFIGVDAGGEAGRPAAWREEFLSPSFGLEEPVFRIVRMIEHFFSILSGETLVEISLPSEDTLAADLVHLSLVGKPISKRKVIFPSGRVLEGAEAAGPIADFLRSGFLVRKAVFPEREEGVWLVTDIDEKKRVGLFSVPVSGHGGTLVLLQGVEGFAFDVCSTGLAGPPSAGGVLLFWSSGGSMICLDGERGGLRWWREIPGFSAQKPLLADLDGDPSREALVFSPAGEIVAVDLTTGRVGPRLKKIGSLITDLKVMDENGSGGSRILAGFKDEGVYLIDPRFAGDDSPLDMALAFLHEDGGSQRAETQ